MTSPALTRSAAREKVVLMLEALVDGNEYVASPLGPRDQTGIRKSTPLRLGNGRHFVTRNAVTRIHTLV